MLTKSVRKIHNINSSKVIGLFYSHKMQGHLAFESTLERDWLLCLDARCDIRSLRCQPHTFRYTDHGKSRRYTPDVLVEFHDDRRPLCYEVKPSRMLESPSFIREFRGRVEAVNREDLDLSLVTERDIRVEPQLSNLKMLKQYASEPRLARSEHLCMREVMATLGTASLNTVQQACTSAGLVIGLPVFYCLIFSGQLDVDLSQPVTPNSLVCWQEVPHVA